MDHSGMTHSSGAMDHLWCGENEVDKDGKCVVAPKEKSNRTLFDQDVDSFVLGTGILDGELRGYIVEPKTAWDYPWVIMIHEWWGLNDNIKYMAKLLAKQGYRVLAIDLYNWEVAADSDAAKKLSGEVRANPEKALAKMKQAVAYLKQKNDKVASLGWCFWWQQSLNISLTEKLDATVIYYGNLTDDKQKLAAIQGPVLGIFWDKDQSVTPESVSKFEAALTDLGKEKSIHMYPGVGHAFANPTGANYAEKETLDAWQKTIDFLQTELKK
jgi:carboxymethylenebutenolidase